MSDDGTYIIRQSGRDRFFYTRRGASYLDRDLLKGPKRFCAWASELRPTPAPFLEPWLAGLAIVDWDERVVWFWLSQAIAGTGAEHALVLRLVQHAWPGWSVRWMDQPARQLAAFLPAHPPRRCLQPPQPLSVEAFSAEQDGPWAAEADNFADLRGEYSEAHMRSWVEWDSHQGAACVVTPDGVHEVMFSDQGWEASALMRAGPAALAVLLAMPAAPLQAFSCDARITSAYWIDPAARTIERWAGHPCWSRPSELAAGWEAWRVSALLGGPEVLMRRLGRDPRLLLRPEDGERLRRKLRHLLGARPAPGAGGLGWAWALAEAVLAEPAFQPLP